MKDLASLIDTIRALKEPAALATLVRVTGSSYRRPGARMVFGADGIRRGLISAGCLEEDVIERLDSVLAGDRPQLVVYDMGSELDLVWGTGMGCAGKVEVLLERVLPGQVPEWMELCVALRSRRQTAVLATAFAGRGLPLGSGFLVGPGSGAELEAAAEKALTQGSPASVKVATSEGEADVLVQPVLPPFALWIYGAGEPARPLVRMARELGWYVGVADHRAALATAERFPGADRFVVGQPPVSLAGLPFDSRTAVLVLSHVYERDQEALVLLHDAPLGYLGLQGNRSRCARLLAELPEASRGRIHAPAGLDLGAETPEAIALSMLAEIQMTLTRHSGGSLRDRAGSIHG